MNNIFSTYIEFILFFSNYLNWSIIAVQYYDILINNYLSKLGKSFKIRDLLFYQILKLDIMINNIRA